MAIDRQLNTHAEPLDLITEIKFLCLVLSALLSDKLLSIHRPNCLFFLGKPRGAYVFCTLLVNHLSLNHLSFKLFIFLVNLANVDCFIKHQRNLAIEV